MELSSSPYVSGALVVGDGQRHLGAILALERDALKELATAAGMPVNDYAQSSAALALVERHVNAVNAAYAKLGMAQRRIAVYKVLPREFSVREGECTPSMQVNREVCAVKFKTLIQSLFEGSK